MFRSGNLNAIIFLLSLICLNCSPTRTKTLLSGENDSAATQNGNSGLLWKPNVLQDDYKLESLDILKNLEISFQNFTDSRENKSGIGSINIGGQNVAVNPGTDIAEWFSKSILSTCRFLGLEQVGKSGTFTFEGEITNFLIQQEVTLHGKIGLRVSVSKDGLTIWEGRVEGNSELYLVPAGSNGVSECMSNALVTTMYNLFNDKSFIDAVVKSKE